MSPSFPSDEQSSARPLVPQTDSVAADQIHNTEAALRASEDRYRTLFEATDVGFCIFEMLFDSEGRPYDYRFLEYNPAFERHTGLTGALGKTARELVPGLDDFWFETYGRVAVTGEAHQFESHAPAMGRWFDVYALRVGQPEERKVGLLFTDVTARKADQEARQQSEEQLRDAQTRLEAALSAGKIATWTFDIVKNRVVADTNLARLFSVTPEAAAGGELDAYLQAIHPDDRPHILATIDEAIAGQNDYEAEYRVVLPDGSHRWLAARGKVERDAAGKALALPGVVVDITDQKEAEARERARLTDIFMRAPAFMATLRGPEHIFDLANLPYIQLVGHRDIQGKPLAEALPEVVTQGFVGVLDQVYQTGEPFVGRDVSVLLQNEGDASLEEHFLDFTYQPLFDEEGAVSGILVHGIDLTERKRLEQERERLLAETRSRAEREALLNQIGKAVRGTLEPDAILQAAVSTLGQGLGVDRCYFVRYDQTRDTARVSPEWYRAEAQIQPLVGHTFQMSSYSVDRDPHYKAGKTHVVDDVVAFAPESAAPLLKLDIRALMRVPIEVGDQMTALGVAMAHEPRHWTQEEVRLVETVATLVHSTLEAAFIQKRERNIAQQLQAALQPPPPNDLPGLRLASFYRPALSEASVGGDFFDVFAVEKGCTALVVADLSGKGLAAASQVATVKNMLRYSLYTATSVAEAVTGLHHALVEHDLLTGFATLFVGMYDQTQRTLTYVNCGQEPGLLWRGVTAKVEQLLPTGPVLGGFMTAGSGYEQKTVTLREGDVLALFTDGLTEVGPSRKNLLEVEGVSDILHSYCAASGHCDDPEAVVDHLVTGVDKFATSGLRDDIALLVGLATSERIQSV